MKEYFVLAFRSNDEMLWLKIDLSDQTFVICETIPPIDENGDYVETFEKNYISGSVQVENANNELVVLRLNEDEGSQKNIHENLLVQIQILKTGRTKKATLCNFTDAKTELNFWEMGCIPQKIGLKFDLFWKLCDFPGDYYSLNENFPKDTFTSQQSVGGVKVSNNKSISKSIIKTESTGDKSAVGALYSPSIKVPENASVANEIVKLK
ncbi:hypothetical protein AKO1_002680 [Acrasis kona]|uniref:Uncharacterized protein n=1 Tax=Acrasis kona TaxID=1008807 RepID=A0AAW2ZMF8_9EUKA